MWMERYFIVVGGTRVPNMPYEPATYIPSWVEWSIMAAAFAGFCLIITIVVKLVPVIAIWEVAEHHEEEKVIPRREAVTGAHQPSPHPGRVSGRLGSRPAEGRQA